MCEEFVVSIMYEELMEVYTCKWGGENNLPDPTPDDRAYASRWRRGSSARLVSFGSRFPFGTFHHFF